MNAEIEIVPPALATGDGARPRPNGEPPRGPGPAATKVETPAAPDTSMAEPGARMTSPPLTVTFPPPKASWQIGPLVCDTAISAPLAINGPVSQTPSPSSGTATTSPLTVLLLNVPPASVIVPPGTSTT